MRELRRARFKALLEGPRFKGDRAAFCAASGLSKGRVSQLLDPAEPFGDVVAQRLVESLGLRAGYFDGRDEAGAEASPPTEVEPLLPLSEREQFLIAAWRTLPPAARTALLADVEALVLNTQNTASSVMHRLDLMRAKGDEYVATKLPPAPAASPGDVNKGGMSHFGDLGPSLEPAKPGAKTRVKR